MQVGANSLNKLSSLFLSKPLGLLIPSYAEFTGFFLISATFFSLAYTLRAGSHIRVSLVVSHLRQPLQRGLEIWSLAVGSLLAGFFSWHGGLLAYDSYRFGDLAVGMIALPLWIPQMGMVLGSLVLLVALVDDLVIVVGNKDPSYKREDEDVPGFDR